MATIEELYLSSLGRDVEQINLELALLENAMDRPGGGRDRAVVASRIGAAARKLRIQLDRESATFWRLFHDPGRSSQATLMQRRIRQMFDRILRLLGPGPQPLGDDSLAEKVKRIQDLKREIVGSTLHQAPLPHDAYTRPGSDALGADPWSSLVLLSAVLFDFTHALLRRRKD